LLRKVADAERSRQRDLIASMGRRRQLLELVVVSALGLFVELLLIRWLDVFVRPLAYVKNLPLIASFLGLGIGFALADRPRSLFPFAAPLLAVTLGVGALMGAMPLFGPQDLESNLGIGVATLTSQLFVFYGSVALIFALVVLATVPLGQIAGAFMQDLSALPAYTANVAGALGGILLVFALSAFSLPLWLNALIAFAIILRYLGPGLVKWTGLVLAGLCCAGMIAMDRRAADTVWSPYNRIELFQIPSISTEELGGESLGWILAVQGNYYQRLLDLRRQPPDRVVEAYPFYSSAHFAYNQPYAWMPRPRDVLVVGAGTGNDVAAALRHGAERIDAVEIDASIQRFGAALHPESPYADPRVTHIIDDARRFLLREPDREYDLIVFGLLDSHISTFSSFSSNIRLDNYVYTLESFEMALDRLTPDGVLSMSFYVEQPWVATRIDAMLRQVYDGPVYVTPLFYDDGYLFLMGPGLEPIADERVTVGLPDWAVAKYPPGPPATDDWPFLYLRERGIPATIAWASAAVLVVGLLVVRGLFRGDVGFDRQLFFLGAGFLLVETRTIAQLGLLFGSTWQVSGITIAAILALILVANFVIERFGALPALPLYAGLLICLLANFAVPASAALGGGWSALFAMAGFYVLPLFFAALIFAGAVRDRENLAPALASNLVGSVLGGLLENLSLAFGIAGLSLLAMALYAASFRR
jgi:SAM-dependent methyltransferase